MKKIKLGECYEFTAENGGRYRIVVVATLGPLLFVHSVFTTGKMQEHSSVQVHDQRFLGKLKKVKLGKPWNSELNLRNKPTNNKT